MAGIRAFDAWFFPKARPHVYRNILVPLDGSTLAEQALPIALGLARRSGAALHFTRVDIPMSTLYLEAAFVPDVDLLAGSKRVAQAYLDGVIKRVSVAADTQVQATLVEGDICDGIVQQAAAVKADLVVMSTHGYGPLSRFWLGSVADKLIRRLPVPKLVVRPSDDGAIDLSHEPELRRLLIPLDGTKEAERILEPAVSLGRLVEAEFLLLRVVQPLPAPVVSGAEAFWGLDVTPERFEQVQVLQRNMEADARTYLEAMAEKLRAQSLRTEYRVVVSDQPSTAILDVAQQQRADLVALETHGRHGLGRLILGSVADKVIRGASLPVLVGSHVSN